MLAVVSNKQDLVPFLVEFGENPECFTPDYHETALSLACSQSFRQTVKYLCEHIPKVGIDPTLRTKAAVHWICQSKDPEIVKISSSKSKNY